MRKPLSIADRLVTRIESPHIVWADKKRTIPEEVVITVWLARYLYPTFWFLVGSIKANKEKVKSLISADDSSFSAKVLNLSSDYSRGFYYRGKSVNCLNILDIFNYVYDAHGVRSEYSRHYDMPHLKSIRHSFDLFLGRKTPPITEAHRVKWEQAVTQAFSELQYYRGGQYRRELMKSDWREAFYLSMMGYVVRPESDPRQPDFEKLIDVILRNLKGTPLDRHILYASFRDGMSNEDIAAELRLTAKKVESVMGKALDALEDGRNFYRDWTSTERTEKIGAKAKSSEFYARCSLDMSQTNPDVVPGMASSLYFWAYMKNRSDSAFPIPDDFIDTSIFVLNSLPEEEKEFAKLCILNNQSLPGAEKALGIDGKKAIQVRLSTLNKLRSPENHALFLYGKKYLDRLSEERRTEIYAELLA